MWYVEFHADPELILEFFVLEIERKKKMFNRKTDKNTGTSLSPLDPATSALTELLLILHLSLGPPELLDEDEQDREIKGIQDLVRLYLHMPLLTRSLTPTFSLGNTECESIKDAVQLFILRNGCNVLGSIDI